MKINKRKIKILSLFGLTIIVLIFFLIYPLLIVIKNSSQEIIRAKNELSSFNQKIENLDKIKEGFRACEADLAKIDTLFADLNMPIDVIKFWEEAAGQSEVLVEINSSGLKKSDLDIWNFIPFQITIFGDFNNFMKFLNKIENGPYLIEIYNMNITSRGLDIGQITSPGAIEANLTVKVFAK
ncbi:MAG: type 4a pilus biogenesis protein PilO [Candidatus Pacebacteria bacterium]|nr:type 4a pilus biogenesis protein PilO [Candidatus Paceibacterota bacterium]